LEGESPGNQDTPGSPVKLALESQIQENDMENSGHKILSGPYSFAQEM
jgi:hypothetical protein